MMRYIPIILCLLLGGVNTVKSESYTFDFYNSDFEAAKKKAGEEGKLFFVDFYAQWCAPCKWMEETAFQDVEVKALLEKNYISVKVDIDNLDGYSLKQKYDIRILPTILIFNSRGEMIARIEETLSSRKLAQLLNHHNIDENKVVAKHTVNQSPRNDKETFKSFSLKPEPAQQKDHQATGHRYRIQMGVFHEFENTYDLVSQLKSKFIEPVIVLNETRGDKMLYKVLMGSFETAAEAEGYRAILKRDFNMDGIVK
ncbi:thioredoxin family protein [Portibacter marinus]|uniref:thioredoxin family protein n=1 Tax=Portibacter marinus TaxID=2898660 RepID=UPI001F1C81EF|nr:thioredoxin family protein [Portibacter marinus]